jgi:spore coat polysaccharide biosynthesis protein SpsF
MMVSDKVLPHDFGFVIQARMDSTRLPGKALLEFAGSTVIEFQMRLIRRFFPDIKIVLATTDRSIDDDLAKRMEILGIAVERGDLYNVFQRLHGAALNHNINNIIRLTGDNPLIHYQVVSDCINRHLTVRPTLTTTRLLAGKKITRFVPKGLSVDILTRDHMAEIESAGLTPFCKEHVIPVFFDQCCKIEFIKGASAVRDEMSIDTAADYIRVKTKVENLLDNNQLDWFLGYQL